MAKPWRTIKHKVGRNDHPDTQTVYNRGMAYILRDNLMSGPSRAMLGDIFPDYPYPRPGALQFANACFAIIYVPYVQEQLNSSNILSRFIISEESHETRPTPHP